MRRWFAGSSSSCRAATTRAETILDDLRDTFGDASARTQFDTAVDWGRYSELLEYDVGTDRIELA